MGVKKMGMIGQAGRGRRLGVLLIAAALLVLAATPAALGADRIYWGNGNDTISYANLDGSGGGGQLNLSGATPSSPRGVAIDRAAGRIYWANQGNDTISYANLDGSGGGGELNISGTLPSKPHGLAIDPAAGRIYWANDDNTISYANLDGSGGDQLDITGATPDSPYGAAIDPVGEDLLGQPGHQHDLLRQPRRIGRRRRAQHLRDDPGRPSRRGYRPGGGEDLLGQRRLHRLHDRVRQPRRIGRRRLLNLTGATEHGAVGMAIDPTAGKDLLGQPR